MVRKLRLDRDLPEEGMLGPRIGIFPLRFFPLLSPEEETPLSTPLYVLQGLWGSYFLWAILCVLALALLWFIVFFNVSSSFLFLSQRVNSSGWEGIE